jgi:hypothetical protein
MAVPNPQTRCSGADRKGLYFVNVNGPIRWGQVHHLPFRAPPTISFLDRHSTATARGVCWHGPRSPLIRIHAVGCRAAACRLAASPVARRRAPALQPTSGGSTHHSVIAKMRRHQPSSPRRSPGVKKRWNQILLDRPQTSKHGALFDRPQTTKHDPRLPPARVCATVRSSSSSPRKWLMRENFYRLFNRSM